MKRKNVWEMMAQATPGFDPVPVNPKTVRFMSKLKHKVRVFNDGPYVEVYVSDTGKILAWMHYWLVGNIIYIGNIEVVPEYRRQGIAGSMIDSLDGIVCLEVRIDNTVAQALYRSRGLRVLKRIPTYYADGADAYYMEQCDE